MRLFTESVVESAALAWLEGLGWSIAHGPDIAPDTLLPKLISGEVRVKDSMRMATKYLSHENEKRLDSGTCLTE